jgi:hypothetical protein
MSRYRFLSLTTPAVAYCAIHQSLPDLPVAQYEATMAEFHGRLIRESRRIAGAYEEFIQTLERKESTALASAVTEYLHPRPRNGRDEIVRIIQEAMQRFRTVILDSLRPGCSSSSENRILVPPSMELGGATAAARGMTYIGDLGFAITPGQGSIYESVFLVDGGENLDLLEYLVRDVLGIYAATHGKHIREFKQYSYALYNRIGETQVGRVASSLNDLFEIALYFSKPAPEIMKYAPFRKSLVQLAEEITGSMPVHRVSLWQRKLGLGAGHEFVLRCEVPGQDAVQSLTEWLAASTQADGMRRHLGSDGKLVVMKALLRMKSDDDRDDKAMS